MHIHFLQENKSSSMVYTISEEVPEALAPSKTFIKQFGLMKVANS